jgi:polyisoprenoid-binding protein YceI
MTLTSVEIPGLVTGRYTIDTAHSEVGFTARHLVVAKVRGVFGSFSGEITIADDVLTSSVTATIDTASVDTRNQQRDDHVRSADFLDVERYPTMTFASTGLRQDGDGYVLTGDLTLHGVTRQVELDLEFNGTTQDPWGGTRIAFSATTEINRRDYGIDINMPLDGGGAVVGDKIKINLEVEAVHAA